MQFDDFKAPYKYKGVSSFSEFIVNLVLWGGLLWVVFSLLEWIF